MATENPAGRAGNPAPAKTGLCPEDPFPAELVALYRKASPEAKLDAIGRLNSMLIGLKEAHLAAEHRDWTPGRRRTELRRWWFGARD